MAGYRKMIGNMIQIIEEKQLDPSREQFFELCETLKDILWKYGDAEIKQSDTPVSEFHIMKEFGAINGYSLNKGNSIFIIQDTSALFKTKIHYDIKLMSRAKWLEYENMGPNVPNIWFSPKEIQLGIGDDGRMRIYLNDRMYTNMQQAGSLWDWAPWKYNPLMKYVMYHILMVKNNDALVGFRPLIELIMWEKFVECDQHAVNWLVDIFTMVKDRPYNISFDGVYRKSK